MSDFLEAQILDSLEQAPAQVSVEPVAGLQEAIEAERAARNTAEKAVHQLELKVAAQQKQLVEMDAELDEATTRIATAQQEPANSEEAQWMVDMQDACEKLVEQLTLDHMQEMDRAQVLD